MCNRNLFIAILCLCLVITTGCWDQVQIEERGFVIGVAIDLPRTKQTERQTEKEAPDKPKGKQRVLVTQQFVIPGGLTGGAGGSGGGGGQNSTNQAYYNLTSEGDSMLEISRELAARTSRSPFYQHLKLVIVSEDIARTRHAFADVLDFFLRNPEMRRNSKIMIAKGQAKSAIEVQPKQEKLPVLYINSVAENTRKSARMLPEVLIGEVHENLLNEMSFVIPRITSNNNEVKVAGSAIFRGYDNKLAGFLGEEETEGLNFLTGRIQGGLLKVPVHDNLVSFDIRGAKQKIEANTTDKENMRFTFVIECEGVIGETFERLDFLDQKIIRNQQKNVAKEIERLAKDTINKVHKDMKTDVLGLGSYLKQERPQLWNQIRNDWDRGRNYFAKSEIQVKAKAYIRNIGDVNKSEKMFSR